MKRSDPEHVIRAAGAITGDGEIFFIRSQSVLGRYPEAPPDLLRSVEAVVHPRHQRKRKDALTPLRQLR